MPGKFQRSEAVAYAYEALEAVKHRCNEEEWKDLDALFTRICSPLTTRQIEDVESFIKELLRASRRTYKKEQA